MSNNFIIIKFGELHLKGKNRNIFVDRLFLHVKSVLKGLIIKLNKEHTWFLVEYTSNEQIILDALARVPGVHSFYKIGLLSHDREEISSKIAKILDVKNSSDYSFKIESKRIDKSLKFTSLEFTKDIADRILKKLKKNIKVDVHNPKDILTFQINTLDIYYSFTSDIHKGMGGFPFGLAGKGLVMLSGGIDSPVASYLAMKQGLKIELFHFDSSPLTPIESVQKVIDIAKKLSQYTLTQTIKLHIVSINGLHNEILSKIKDSYTITILRRMMYRIASLYAKRYRFNCLINGESLGQVASQTIESIQAVSCVTDQIILRPLVTYDKSDIVILANKIETFDISIRSFNDCCSIYVPTTPVIKPKIEICKSLESFIDYSFFIKDILSHIKTFNINPKTQINISDYGIDFLEAYTNYDKNIKQG